MIQRPGGLTALCIVAIVLGALGILSGLTGAAGMAMRARIEALTEHIQDDEDAAKLQRRVSQRANAVWEEHPIRTWSLVAGRLLVATLLVVGGSLTLKLKPAGRAILLAAFATGVVFEALQIVPNIQAANASYDAMLQAMEETVSRDEQRPPGFDQTMSTIMKASAIMQILIAVAMLVGKCAYYAVGLWYVTRARVAASFARPASEAEPPGELAR